MSVYTVPGGYTAQTPLTETRHTGGFIVSMGNGHQSIDRGILAQGSVGLAGTVLGKITASGKYIPAVATATDGSQNAAGILYAATDATLADTHVAVVVRTVEVNGGELDYGAANGGQITAFNAELTALGIVIR